jgi:hypothetical protein
MSASDIYRQRALELCQRANAQSNFDIRTEYESLAFAYMCLAEQTESDLLEWACVDAAKDLGLNRPSRVNAPGTSS